MSRSPKTKAATASWHDGDTTLLFGVIVAICGILILWRALDPGNWQVLADEARSAHSAARSLCPPSAMP